MWMTGLSSERVGDRLLGGHRRHARRPAAARRPGPGRHDQRLWHVQRAGDELLAPAAGDGAGRHAAARSSASCIPARGLPGSRFWSAPRDGRCAWDWASSAWSPSTSCSTEPASALEFVALIVLRIREPELPRPFRVPGGMFGAVAVGIAPMLLLGFSIVRSQSEQVLGMSSFAFGMLLIGGGSGRLFPESYAQARRVEHGARQAASRSRPSHGFLTRICTD